MLQLYKNIKKKRLELGLSQEELAKKTGYSSRSMIAKIEAGDIDLYQSKIDEIAKALDTTSAELMGWENITIEDKYNMVSSSNSLEIDRYATYLLLSERQNVNASNRNKYIDFIVASKVSKLNDIGKEEALKRVTELTEIKKYTTNPSIDVIEFDGFELKAAHERTDIEVTAEMRKHDDDIMSDENF